MRVCGLPFLFDPTQATDVSCVPSGIPWSTFVNSTISPEYPLARALQKVFDTLLYHPFSATIRIASLPLYIQLPLPHAPADMDWARWEERPALRSYDDDAPRRRGQYDSDDDDIEDDEDANRPPSQSGDDADDDDDDAGPLSPMFTKDRRASSSSIKPWKALLLVDPDPPSRRPSEDNAWFTSPTSAFARMSNVNGGGGSSRPKSRTTSISTFNDLNASGFSAAGSARLRSSHLFSATFASSGSETPLGTTTPTIAAYEVDDETPEEERLPFFKLFMQHCKPSLSLLQISRREELVEAGVSLKRDILPLARLLVWKASPPPTCGRDMKLSFDRCACQRKARVIDPVKSGTHNVYVPASSYGKE